MGSGTSGRPPSAVCCSKSDRTLSDCLKAAMFAIIERRGSQALHYFIRESTLGTFSFCGICAWMVGILSNEIGQKTLLYLKNSTYIPANVDPARFCTVSTCW